MPEEIMQAIEQYIEAHPGTQINQERLKGMQENAKSLKRICAGSLSIPGQTAITMEKDTAVMTTDAAR
jgi:hypothetical protein